MAEITINKENVTNQLNQEATVNDLIDQIMEGIAKEKEVITKITVDGISLDSLEEDLVLGQKVGSYQNIDFTLQSSIELAYEALDSCNNYIDVALGKIQNLAELYSKNKIAEANGQFAQVIEIMDIFVQLISKIHRTIKIHSGDKFVKGKTIQDLEFHLLSIMKALIPAKEKEDIIMLCDLLEYELADNLTQWKIKAIPEMKKFKKE